MNLAMSSAQNTYSLSDLLAGIAKVGAGKNPLISGIEIDSRKVSAGDLFIALPGTRQHGNTYIDAAIRQGAIAVVYDASTELPADLDSEIPLIKITDIPQQAGLIASRFYNEPSKSMRVTGITGTNGKTTCCVLLAQAYKYLGATPSLIGTLGMGLWGEMAASTHTTPDAVTLQSEMSQLRDLGSDELLMEVSSHGLEQGRVCGTEFNIAVLTNLSQDHLDYHGSMQDYAAAKAKLFYQNDLDLAVINIDDKFGGKLLDGPVQAEQIISYGIDNGDVHASQIILNEAGIELEIKSPWGELKLHSSLMGRFNVYNLLACAAVLLASGYRADDVASALSEAESAAGRMECFRAQGVTVVVDFAHSPDALQQVLIALREHIQARRLICVFGCGGDRDQAKRPIMGRIAEQLSDTVFITDDNSRHEDPAEIRSDIIAGMTESSPETLQEIPDRRQAINAAWQLAEQGDIILIAGKGHEATQQIGDLKIPFNDREVVSALLSDAPGEQT